MEDLKSSKRSSLTGGMICSPPHLHDIITNADIIQNPVCVCSRQGSKCKLITISLMWVLFTGAPQSQLPKFVQINWCGDGVPEAKKGLFHTHSSAVANYLRGSHVVISARNEVGLISPFSMMFLTILFFFDPSVRCHSSPDHEACRSSLRRQLLGA